MSVDLLERLRAALADRYAVESEIGRGGMATVYLAEDLKHHRRVAIKVLHPELAAALGPDRFLREIQIAAHLEHPAILPLHDSGEADGLPYYVMPYVEGESLRERLESEGPLPGREALGIAAEVADGLAYAHRQGVVHRDIKPGNILLSEQHARVADFGIARALGAASEGDATATGLAVGTPKYMSPEQAAGGEVDGRADVYALGCVLWEMLVGEPPFDGPTPAAILARKVAGTSPDLRAAGRPIPAELERVLARAMAPDPDNRFQTAGELAAALKEPSELVLGHRSGRRSARTIALIIGTAAALLAVRRVLPPGERDSSVDPNLIVALPFGVVGPGEDLQIVAEGIPDLFWMKVNGDFGPRAADPGTVRQLWISAGGSAGSSLSESKALELAKGTGAGRLVIGVLSGAGDRMTLTARLLELPSGRVRVSQTSVEGPADSYLELTDGLINQLLARDFGEALHRLPTLAQFAPSAVQAYLRGLKAGDEDYDLSNTFFDEALHLDSTLVLAALAKYQSGERDVAAARYAWEQRSQLSRRDQMLLRAVAGWRFGVTRTVSERIAQFDSAGLEDWDRANDVVWSLHVLGQLSATPGWRSRDRAARERIGQLRTSVANLYRLFELAAAAGDTVAMRTWLEALKRSASSPPARTFALSAEIRYLSLIGETAPDDLWSEVAQLPLVDASNFAVSAVLAPLLDGVNLAGLDRVVGSLPPAVGRGDALVKSSTGMGWARARGRYREWRMLREEYLARHEPVVAAMTRIRDVLFLGEPGDSSAYAAADWLRAVAGDAGGVPSADSGSTPELTDHARALCWSTLWRVAHGDLGGAPEAIRYLRKDTSLPYRYSVCASLIEVFMAEREGIDTRSMIDRLDSVVAPVPMEDPTSGLRDGTHFIDNLFLAQRLAQIGDTVRALAVSRRAKPWESELSWYSRGTFVDLLREEARLAAAVGDSAGAADAYAYYFRLRDTRPDHPPWAAQWDSMRVEYAALTGVETP